MRDQKAALDLPGVKKRISEVVLIGNKLAAEIVVPTSSPR
jgi:hypothetical protein